MRFPFSLTRAMTAYLLRKKLAGEKTFPLVLMLEPLHASNLSGASGGRAREYAETLHCRLSLERCLAAVTECGAPIVSLCGGEPLLYPDIGVLVESLVARQTHVYLCTNGTLLAKMLPAFRPSSRLLVNVRLDGMETTHDRLAERAGVFAAAVRGILDAKVAGFTVSTETTIYQDTDLHEIAVLFDYLYELGVDGFMLSPAFAAASPEARAEGAARFFATREEVHAKFRTARTLLRHFRLTASPLYMEFLCGERELDCAAWTNPTYNVQGWRGPCYLLGDAHYETYRELVDSTAWRDFGPAGDCRCARCLGPCGFEPAAVLSAPKGFRDAVRLAMWQMT